eukprot:scaffold13142_cov45-Prasinocladus_malaysianus.AAC.1
MRPEVPGAIAQNPTGYSFIGFHYLDSRRARLNLSDSSGLARSQTNFYPFKSKSGQRLYILIHWSRILYTMNTELASRPLSVGVNHASLA